MLRGAASWLPDDPSVSQARVLKRIVSSVRLFVKNLVDAAGIFLFCDASD